GTVIVNTLDLAIQNLPSSVTMPVTGTFILGSGATLNALLVQPGPSVVGPAATNRNFNWSDGSICNYNSGSGLTISSGITFNVAATGTHTFNISSGQTGNVNSVLGGAGGTIVKTGLGTLNLGVTNSYTGNTNLSAGST